MTAVQSLGHEKTKARKRSFPAFRVFALSSLIVVIGGAQALAERKAGLNAMSVEPATTRTIEKGDQSNVDDAKQVLVRTDDEWTKLWQQHASGRPRPAVDFSKEMIVGVFMGSRPNAGFSTAIVSATAGNGVLIVRYTETMPTPGMVAAQVLTFPFHLVAIPKATVTNVTFEKVAK
jgi:hypothetical protein